MIKRKDLKVDAEFLDKSGDRVTIVYIGDGTVVFKLYPSDGEPMEILSSIDDVLGNWNYPEPNKPRTVEFFEWIDTDGELTRTLVTKNGTRIYGDKDPFYHQCFLAWTGRSFHLEVDENWGEE